MIITCNSCAKSFNIDPSLIPVKGRLVQCNSCNHKWFFKKELLNEPIITVKTDKLSKEAPQLKEESEHVIIENPKSIQLLDRKIKDDFIIQKSSLNESTINSNSNEDKNINIDNKVDFFKKKKQLSVLSLIIIFIISFIALIIIFDTFQSAISEIFPNIEIILYHLYETFNDIRLFLLDLI